MLKIGVIGCGKITQVRHAPEYAENPECTLMAWYDAIPERAQAMASLYGGKVCESIDELLALQLDAVSICVANRDHASVTIRALEAGTLRRIPQDHDAATYEPKMDKELGRIDWTKSATVIDCLVRGTTPWPGAFTTLDDQTIKVFELEIRDGAASGKPGEIIAADAKRGLVVSCGDHDVELKQIQMPGAKRMNAKDYLRGHTMDTGVCLGKA